VDNLHITDDPRYLHRNGKPVLMVWGFFADRFSTNLAHQIIDYFKTNATYGVTLVGGGEWYWRTESTPGWSNVFRRFDGILVAGFGGGQLCGDALSAGHLSGFQLG
jgi:hypothetical protein